MSFREALRAPARRRPTVATDRLPFGLPELDDEGAVRFC